MSMPSRKRASVFSSVVMLALLAACSGPEWERHLRAPHPLPLDAGKLTICSLPGWKEDHHAQIMPALLSSCAAIRRRPPISMVSSAIAGSPADWLRLCVAAEAVANGDDSVARDFFERWLVVAVPIKATQTSGVLTGYHEVQLTASPTKSKRFAYPIYRLPNSGGTLPTRAQASKGALKGQELLFLDSPIDGLWLELNGAGRAVLPDGRRVMIEYAGQNGYPAKFLTQVMAEHGIAPAARMTRARVSEWARRNPKTARRLIDENKSMVFFRMRDDAAEGPRGALGVPLTAGRSLAVDPRHVPLGALAWVAGGYVPALGRPFRRLMAAQDTGGAIKGANRGDVFWGVDEEDVASRFKISGTIFTLAPRAAPLPFAGCVGVADERLTQVGRPPLISLSE